MLELRVRDVRVGALGLGVMDVRVGVRDISSGGG